MKIRVMPLTQCRLTFERLGYLSAAIPYGEVYSSLQTGIVDGQMGGGPQQAINFKDVQKYYIHYQEYLEPVWYCVNCDAWNSLPPDLQKVLNDNAVAACRESFQTAPATDKRYMKEFTDYPGNEVIIPSDEELAACAAAIQKDVWPKLEGMIGKGLIYKLYDELGIAH